MLIFKHSHSYCKLVEHIDTLLGKSMNYYTSYRYMLVKFTPNEYLSEQLLCQRISCLSTTYSLNLNY